MTRHSSSGWQNYSEHFLSGESVAAYDELYARDTADSRGWSVQRRYLHELLMMLPRNDNSALDYACGTGRISEVLCDTHWSVTGVDTSAAMLEIARGRVPDAHFVEGDLVAAGQADTWLGPFMLTTAFRLFLNVDDRYRLMLLNALRLRTDPSGYVIFNNHGSSPSLRALFLWLRRDKRSTVLPSKQVDHLVKRSGLEVERIFSCGLFTRRIYEMPKAGRIALAVELKLQERPFGRWVLARFGSDQLYVCRVGKSRRAKSSIE